MEHNQSEPIHPESVSFPAFMTTAGNAAHEKGVDQLKPTFVQDGGAEIHPDLKGITFQFFANPDTAVQGIAVNYDGDAPDAPWAPQLTGRVFKDFTEAKTWLRQEAQRLASDHKAQGRRGDTSKSIHHTLDA